MLVQNSTIVLIINKDLIHSEDRKKVVNFQRLGFIFAKWQKDSGKNAKSLLFIYLLFSASEIDSTVHSNLQISVFMSENTL